MHFTLRFVSTEDELIQHASTRNLSCLSAALDAYQAAGCPKGIRSAATSRTGHRAFGPRYWGAENYGRLQEIKRANDPSGIFWCHH
eukprot:SAG22_NODE_2121_length_2979_cov_4.426736_3_plen_85_part_01